MSTTIVFCAGCQRQLAAGALMWDPPARTERKLLEGCARLCKPAESRKSTVTGACAM